MLTVSDRTSRGEAEDKSGPLAVQLLQDGMDIKATEVLPDEPHLIQNTLKHWADNLHLNLIITTGSQLMVCKIHLEMQAGLGLLLVMSLQRPPRL